MLEAVLIIYQAKILFSDMSAVSLSNDLIPCFHK